MMKCLFSLALLLAGFSLLSSTEEELRIQLKAVEIALEKARIKSSNDIESLEDQKQKIECAIEDVVSKALVEEWLKGIEKCELAESKSGCTHELAESKSGCTHELAESKSGCTLDENVLIAVRIATAIFGFAVYCYFFDSILAFVDKYKL